MADTIRERIIQAFVQRAAKLTNVPVKRVERSTAESKQRFVSVWDLADQDAGSAFGQDKRQFGMGLEVIWQQTATNPSIEANALMGEITTVMIGSTTDKTFGGLVNSIRLTSSSPNYPDDGSNAITLTVIFTINYTTLAGDPYTAPAY